MSVRTEHLATVDSTSLEARRRIRDGLDAPLLIVADVQTGGVGRHGRPWHSPRGGLWMTLAHPVAAVDPALAIRVSQIVCAHVRALPVPEACVKWPNDVYIADEKVAGVLVEVTPGTPSWAIVGIGVNANVDRADLAPVLRGHATTLRHALSRSVDLDGLRRRIIEDVTGLFAGPPTPLRIEPAAVWRYGREVEIECAGVTRRGVVAGIGADGALLLRDAGGTWSAPVDASVRSVRARRC